MESASLALRSSSSSSYFLKSSNFNPTNFKKHKKIFLKPLNCLQNPNPTPNLTSSSSSSSSLSSSSSPLKSTVSYSAVTETPLETTDFSTSKLHNIISEFKSLPEPVDRVKHLLRYATLLPEFDEWKRVPENRVMGCTAQVWLDVSMDELGRMRFKADSDSEITKGFCSCLIEILDGVFPEEVLKLKTEDLGMLNVGLPGRANSRANTWYNVLISMQKRTKILVAEKEGKGSEEMFPTLIITADDIRAKGSYAEAQAKFLFPDETKVQELVNVLREKKIGIVAHFYMDPEVQGVLTAAQKEWPHIHISDSLVMADKAVKMAEAGCEFITVLGVDFMSENVRAILDQAGFEKVGVYRMSSEIISCSLADAASSPSYTSYLEAASSSVPSLHVIYINTSLETKAFAHELVPTITCTSSNVVQTILQAFAQVKDLNLWYGPDSYMGANIAELFQQMASMTNEEISEIHPQHNRDSIRSVLQRLHYYQDGTCIVHDLFGHEVVKKIQELYCDAYLTAHFEVPGEMFASAMEAKRRGMGVVGSTQNILDFIKERVQEALDRNHDEKLQFVLGTEVGMVTSIVAAVRKLLRSPEATTKISVEIVFPVSSDAVSSASQGESKDLFGLSVIPGVATGEGCSINGGCASCPYMKMNSLSSLLRVCLNLPDKENNLSAYVAGRFSSETPLGFSVADVGCEPILHMRHFQATKKLPEKLVSQILRDTSAEGR